MLEYAERLSCAFPVLDREFVETRGRGHHMLNEKWFDKRAIAEKRRGIQKLIRELSDTDVTLR